jgi:hypothetical protein
MNTTSSDTTVTEIELIPAYVVAALTILSIFLAISETLPFVPVKVQSLVLLLKRGKSTKVSSKLS